MTNQTEYKLSFCTVYHRDDGISMIEINEGVEVDTDMSNELVELAKNVLGERPIALLSNRVHSYSLSFQAMSILANLPNLIALAIVAYTTESKLLIETQNFFISAMKKKPVKIFSNIDEGIEWLHKALREHPHK